MEKIDLKIRNMDPSLYNADLAPLPMEQRKWGWFEIFNVWSNDIQSLFGYTLAATLFISYGLNGWTVFAGIILAGIIYLFFTTVFTFIFERIEARVGIYEQR